METVAHGYAFQRGDGSQAVEVPEIMPQEWREFLDSIPEGGLKGGAKERAWTDAEDRFLLEARKRGAYWRDICQRIGCNETTARSRYRKLTERA